MSLSGTNGLSRTESLETSCDERDSQSGRAAKRHSLGFAEWRKKKNENNNQYGLPKSVGEKFEGHIYTLKKFSDIISLKDQSRQLKEGTEKIK